MADAGAVWQVVAFNCLTCKANFEKNSTGLNCPVDIKFDSGSVFKCLGFAV